MTRRAQLAATKMRKPRLPRLEWLYTKRLVYFITTNTHERQKLLDCAAADEAFVRFSEGATTRGVLVGRYVLMPDHLHLFAAFTEDAISLSAWVQSLKVKLAQALRAHGRGAPYWQKDFFDHVLRSAESYAEKWEYVRQNPVRAGLVERAEDWPYQGEIHRLAGDEL